MISSKYTVKQFKAAWFEKDFSVISEPDFKILHAEYQDASGLYLTDDFEKISYIHHLHSRINYVKIFIRLQREFIEEFDIPFVRDFEILKKRYGYVLTWNANKNNFEEQLQKIEKKEIKFLSTLEARVQELNKSREQSKKDDPQEDDETVLRKSRIAFIRMLNSLGKIGYKLDQDVTTVEELALMIKQQMEEIESLNNQMANSGR